MKMVLKKPDGDPVNTRHAAAVQAEIWSVGNMRQALCVARHRCTWVFLFLWVCCVFGVAFNAAPVLAQGTPLSESLQQEDEITAAMESARTEIEGDVGTDEVPTLPSAAASTPSGDEGPMKPEREQIVEVGLDDRVTMHLADLPLPDAVRMLSEPTKRNIIIAEGAKGTVTASLYRVTFDEALQAMLVSNGLGYRTEGEFVFIYPLETLQKMQQAKRRIQTRVFHLSYVNALAAKTLLEPLLSSAGKIAVTPAASKGLGGTEGIADTAGDSVAMTDALIITDYTDRLEEIDRVLVELDVRPKQVLIEATILRATLNDDNALGIDFTTVGGIDFTTLTSVSPAAQSITTANTPTDMLGDTTFTARTELNSALPSGGFTFGIIKDQVSLFIRALEQISDTNILANPKVLALNKQIGQVIVGRRDGYFTTTVTETSTVQTVEFLETGTILTFRPFIGNDGYVRMEIHPKDSTGSVGDNNLPFEQTTEVTTNIIVRDGHTVLIGGLFREVTDTVRGQVPGLGNLPVAGALFRRTRDGTLREEVIILLTVHILESEEADRVSRELEQESERYRVGSRRGAQWLGRERLAQLHYHWALEHLERGDVGKAMWDAEMALECNERDIDAYHLVEKLQDKRAWEAEGSSIRDLIRTRLRTPGTTSSTLYERPIPAFHVPEEFDGPAGMETDEGAATPSDRVELDERGGL